MSTRSKEFWTRAAFDGRLARGSSAQALCIIHHAPYLRSNSWELQEVSGNQFGALSTIGVGESV